MPFCYDAFLVLNLYHIWFSKSLKFDLNHVARAEAGVSSIRLEKLETEKEIDYE